MSEAAPNPETPPKRLEKQATKPRESGLLADPVVRVMAYVALGLLVLFLASVVSVLGTGVTQRTGPRSIAERRLMMASEQLEKGAKGEAWAPYIDALIASKDLSAARVALSQARASATATMPVSDLDLAEARLLSADEQYESAVTMADKAMKGYLAERDARIAKGGEIATAARASGPGEGYYNAILVRAYALVKLKRWKEAIAAFDVYIKVYTTASDIFIDRGNAKVEIGDKAGAEKDFRSALKFVPYDEEAKAGLTRIGVTP